MVRGRAVLQVVAGVVAVMGFFGVIGAMRPRGAGSVLEGVVSGYERVGGSGCFLVSGERACVGGRVVVSRETVMTVAEKATEERRRDARSQQRVMRSVLFVGCGMMGWVCLYWRRALAIWVPPPQKVWVVVLFRGFVGWGFVDGLVRLAGEVRMRPVGWEDVVGTVVMGGVVYFFFRHFVREIELRRRTGRLGAGV